MRKVGSSNLPTQFQDSYNVGQQNLEDHFDIILKNSLKLNIKQDGISSKLVKVHTLYWHVELLSH